MAISHISVPSVRRVYSKHYIRCPHDHHVISMFWIGQSCYWRGGGARRVIVMLGKESKKHLLPVHRRVQPTVADVSPATKSTGRRCFRGFVKVFEEYFILPSSYIIPGSNIQKLGGSNTRIEWLPFAFRCTPNPQSLSVRLVVIYRIVIQ